MLEEAFGLEIDIHFLSAPHALYNFAAETSAFDLYCQFEGDLLCFVTVAAFIIFSLSLVFRGSM